MTGYKITEGWFKEIKRDIRWKGTKKTAEKHNLHLSTVLNVKGCKNFDEYERVKKAEHPDTKDSLADRVFELHALTFRKPNVPYFTLPSARRAVVELQLRQIKLNKEMK